VKSCTLRALLKGINNKLEVSKKLSCSERKEIVCAMVRVLEFSDVMLNARTRKWCLPRKRIFSLKMFITK
jgi:hypothetical protein